MRLLFVHDHRFHRGENGERFTLGSFPAEVWDRYLEHFDRVHVVARDGGPLPAGAQLSRSDRENVSFEDFPSLSSLRQLIVPSPGLDRQMKALVAESDAVVARLPSEIGLLAVKHARRLGKPYALEVVACPWDSYFHNGAVAARLYAPLAYLRHRRAVADAPLALYVTSAWLQRRYPTKGATQSASNVYLQPRDSAAAEGRRARLAAIATGHPPVLGTVASLQTRTKGIQTSIAALAKLRSTGLDLTYRVLGAGRVKPWQDLAEKCGVADLVHFDGTRSAGKDVASWLDEIDIYLQPSFQEGLPRATIEAMSRGAACIGSTCGGIPELLPPERVHRPGDVDVLAELIRRLATDPAALADASARDLDRAREFDPETLMKRRREFYAQLRKQAERSQ